MRPREDRADHSDGRQEQDAVPDAHAALRHSPDTLPMELTFVDDKDCVRFWNGHEARESGSYPGTLK